MRLILGVNWKDWCWSWNSNTLATSWEKLTHLKRPWCWQRLRAGGEGDDRAWDGWMASPTQWTRVWVDSGSWWWTGRSGVLQFMGLQRVRHDWVTELNSYVKKCPKSKTQVHETQRVPNRINPRWNTPRHILIKLTTIKHKEQILKAARKKTKNNTQGDSHQDNSQSFNRNSSGQEAMAGHT